MHHIYIYIYIERERERERNANVNALNGPGVRSSIPGQVIPKTQKMVHNSSLLNTQNYKIQIKSKWSNAGKGAAPFPTPHCCSYWKGSLWVVLDYGRPTYIYIYIYIYTTPITFLWHSRRSLASRYICTFFYSQPKLSTTKFNISSKRKSSYPEKSKKQITWRRI